MKGEHKEKKETWKNGGFSLFSVSEINYFYVCSLLSLECASFPPPLHSTHGGKYTKRQLIASLFGTGYLMSFESLKKV